MSLTKPSTRSSRSPSRMRSRRVAYARCAATPSTSPVSRRKSVQSHCSSGAFCSWAWCSPLPSTTARRCARHWGSKRCIVLQPNAEVKAALGEPIHAGLLASGAIHEDETGVEQSQAKHPASRPEGQRHAQSDCRKGSGPWVISTLEVLVESQPKPIDLLHGRVETTSSQTYVDCPHPARDRGRTAGRHRQLPLWDGSFPIVQIAPVMAAGADIKFRCSLGVHEPSVVYNSPANTYEVDLRSGMFVLRHTDLLVKDVMPLTLTRTYREMGHSHPRVGNGDESSLRYLSHRQQKSLHLH